MIKLILKERLLNEVKVEDVIATINDTDKKFIKMVYSILSDRAKEKFDLNPEKELKAPGGMFELGVRLFKRAVQETIPSDITPVQQGQAAIWLKRFFLSDKSMFNLFVDLGGNEGRRIVDNWNYAKKTIEKFYMMNRFIPQELRDIHRVPSIVEMEKLIDAARPAYEAYREKLTAKDTAAGTEILNSSLNFELFIANNVGAACKLGKNTDWCTAAPGGNAFNNYYTKEDPLFVLISKDNPVEKYQFHFGTNQFKDIKDSDISSSETKEMCTELIMSNPDLMERYPIIQKHLLTYFGLNEFPENFPWNMIHKNS